MNRNRLILLLKKYDYVVVFFFLLALCVVLMSRTSYYQSSKLISWTNSIAGGWYEGVHSISGYFGLKSENDRLAAENAYLRARLASSYISYTDSTFTVRDTVYKQRFTYTEARVIKNSWSQQNNYVMINKGRSHGIAPDMAVISPDGIVGVVMSVSDNFATIMPVLHSDSRNSVKVKRTGISGSLVWDGKDSRYAIFEDLPRNVDYNNGDTVVTTGYTSSFPKNVPVGRVVDTFDGGGSFLTLHVELFSNFNRLNAVHVIFNKEQEERDQLQASVSANE